MSCSWSILVGCLQYWGQPKWLQNFLNQRSLISYWLFSVLDPVVFLLRLGGTNSELILKITIVKFLLWISCINLSTMSFCWTLEAAVSLTECHLRINFWKPSPYSWKSHLGVFFLKRPTPGKTLVDSLWRQLQNFCRRYPWRSSYVQSITEISVAGDVGVGADVKRLGKLRRQIEICRWHPFHPSTHPPDPNNGKIFWCYSISGTESVRQWCFLMIWRYIWWCSRSF